MKQFLFTLILGALLHGCQKKIPDTNNHTEDKRNDSPTLSLEGFTNKLLDTCKASSSEAKRTIIVGQTVRVAKETFPERTQQEAFLLMICIESRFDNSQRSKVGAVGYTQLMPKFAQDFSTACNMGKINEKDIQDGELNLRLGACQFKKLLDRFDGNVALALSGYNSGPDSQTTKNLNRLGEANPETGSYISKFLVLQEKMK